MSVFIFLRIVAGGTLSFSTPFEFYGDALFAMMMIRPLADGDWFPFLGIHSSRAGFPGEMNLGDFPMAENLHFAILKFISFFVDSSAAIYNTYYLLTFVFTAWSATYVMRRLRIHGGIALVIGILYSFLPYHYRRFEHLFLASYYLLPLLTLVLLWLWSSKPLFFAHASDGGWKFDWKSKRALFAAVVLLCAGSGGVYYAFFFCFFALVAGISAKLYRDNSKHLLSAIIACMICGSSLLLNLAPNILYTAQNGKNPAVAGRYGFESEIYGLKLANMILPKSNHRIAGFAKKKAWYHSITPKVEGYDESIGTLFSFAFMALLGVFIFYRKRHDIYSRLGTLATSGVLFAYIGSFSLLFASFINPQIRAHNRISIFLAFFAALTLAATLQRLKLAGWFRGWRLAAFSVSLLAFGVFDQATPDFVGVQNPEEFESDRQFVESIEAQNPSGVVLQLPYLPFPENPPIEKMNDYSHARGLLHSSHLKWSYGAIKGREAAAINERLSAWPLNLAEIRKTGYTGIYIDRSGYADGGKQLEQALASQLGGKPLISMNARLVYFALQ
jgi:phosphoglycerol transferase